MPWRVGTMSEIRLNFVIEVKHLKSSVAAACRKYGISRKTGHKWLRRYRAEGAELTDRRRRPQTSPMRTKESVEQEVLAIRDEHGWGAPKIWAFLRNQAEVTARRESFPSERTLGNILRRHGRIAPGEPAESSPQFFERSSPHELWQCDFKGPLEVERRRVHPFTILDDHSRYLLALRMCDDVQMKSAWAALWDAFAENGMPEKLLCDGAFAGGVPGLRTVSWIEGQLIRLGIHPLHGRPYHPQTQGKVERLHGTLEREVWPHVDRTDRKRFAAQVEKWRREVYNPLRPHESLDGRPPLSRFAPSPRRRPARLPEASYPAGSVLRRVASGGDISWRGCRILVGAGLVKECVRVEEREKTVAVYFCWKQIREIPFEQMTRDRLL